MGYPSRGHHTKSEKKYTPTPGRYINTRMENIKPNLEEVREKVDLFPAIVIGGALKLAMAIEKNHDDDRRNRMDSGMTVYFWELHSSRVKRVAKDLRSILPPL